MSSPIEENRNDGEGCSTGNSNGNGNGGFTFGPCACCVALAQVHVRMVHDNPAHIATVPATALPQAAATAVLPEQSGPGPQGTSPAAGLVFSIAKLFGGKPARRKSAAVQRSAPVPMAAEAGAPVDKQNADHDCQSEKDATARADHNGSEPGESSEVRGDDWSEEIKVPKPRRLWHGLDGIAVTVLGIVTPALMFILSCLSMPKRVTLVLLNHPLETIAEMVLLAAIPAINYLVWSALCANKLKFPRLSAVALGSAAGSALITAAVCVAALFASNPQMVLDSGTDFSLGFSWIAFLALLAGAVSTFIVARIRATRDFSSTKKQVVVYATVGALLPFLAVAAAEGRPWCIRVAEHMAVSSSKKEQREGLAWLRGLDPERELRMECSDPRAAGICGLFIALKPTSQHQLYFSLTGKPYSFREFKNEDMSSMPDDYLSRNVVGDEMPGLALTRSTLSSVIHPRTMSAAVAWTFVFKNDTGAPQEARAEIGLPPGAVVTGLTSWSKGEAQDATFVASGKAEGISDWSQVGHDSPAIVTDLGHGRVLMHCYPVPQEEEAKIRINMIVPLNPERAQSASMLMPGFIAANFRLDGGEHVLRVRGKEKLTAGIKGVSGDKTPGGEYVLSASLTEADLKSSKLLVETRRGAIDGTVAVMDTLAVKMGQEEQKRLRELEIERARNKEREQPQQQVLVMVDGSKGIDNQIELVRRAFNKKAGKKQFTPVIRAVPARYVVETVERVSAAAPSHLVVVIDGSVTTGPFVESLHSALNKLPKGIPCDVIIASQEETQLAAPIHLAKALGTIKNVRFIGGQDNLKAVVKAAELAGETKGSAVLWIHGPQPVLNQEIYIMSAYAAAPAFYEMALGTGDTDTFAFFKNHPEVGPFHPVPRSSADVGADLANFFGRWTPDSSSYAMKLCMTTKKPAKFISLTNDEVGELLVLHANKRCVELLSAKRTRLAATVAVRYGFVSPVSSVLITTNTATVHEGDSLDAFSNNIAVPEKSSSADAPIQERASGTANSSTESGGGDQFIADGQAPQLQGATNGTIGPIAGVNTAGTVRVNNLANLEALLNIFANLGEIGLLIFGLVLVVHGLFRGHTVVELMGQEIEIAPGRRVALGALLMLAGWMLPGVLNWFVASARDANLFS